MFMFLCFHSITFLSIFKDFDIVFNLKPCKNLDKFTYVTIFGQGNGIAQRSALWLAAQEVRGLNPGGRQKKNKNKFGKFIKFNNYTGRGGRVVQVDTQIQR